MQAKEEGLVRFIGVTGHGVTVAAQHLRSLEEYPFDSVLLPYNFPMSRNRSYMADFEALVEVCAERDVAVQTIKAITRGTVGRSGADCQHLVRAAHRPRSHRHRSELGAGP